jgi:bifunctional non-homologous end joining protein LigD
VYEEKYDGWRILALKANGRSNFSVGNGRDHARRLAEIARVIASLHEDTLILDGEVAIFDEHLISRFEWLRHGARESLSTPPIYMVFDVLKVGSQDLRQEPLRTRRKEGAGGSPRRSTSSPTHSETHREWPRGMEGSGAVDGNWALLDPSIIIENSIASSLTGQRSSLEVATTRSTRLAV